MDWLRQSGKLKAERYIVNGRRQIDDPDDPRSFQPYSGKIEHNTKLFAEDTYSSGYLQDERR